MVSYLDKRGAASVCQCSGLLLNRSENKGDLTSAVARVNRDQLRKLFKIQSFTLAQKQF